ncbi:YbjQ family protein, partial [Micromonospora sp. MSM11]
MAGSAPAVRAAPFCSIRSGEQGRRSGARRPDSIGSVLVVTTEQLPGYEIRQTLGEVVSSMARTRNPYREGVKNLRGGAYDPMAPDNLTRWRTDSVARLGEEARRLGANAVVGMRFDSRDCGEMWMEICAYGTAVVVAPKMPDVMPPDQPLVAAETAHDPAFAESPGGIAEPA